MIHFVRQGLNVPTSVEAINACVSGGFIEFEAGIGTLRRLARNVQEAAAEARHDSPPSELLELVWTYPDIRIWTLRAYGDIVVRSRSQTILNPLAVWVIDLALREGGYKPVLHRRWQS